MAERAFLDWKAFVRDLFGASAGYFRGVISWVNDWNFLKIK